MHTNKMPTGVKYIIGAIIALFATIILLFTIEFKTIKGGELGILETWSDGVVDKVYQPKNYWLFPGWSQEMYSYDSTLLTYEISDYSIKSSDNQEMTLNSKVQWRRDPSKLVHHHKTFRQNAAEVAITPAMLSAILRHGTGFRAIDAFSGEGFNKMQSEIQKDLINNAQLKEDGIIIETFIIVAIHLRDEYIKEINLRQLANLRQTRAVEEQKAAEAEALVAKAKAQADLNTQVVGAERDQQIAVIKAKADSEKMIINAKAEAEQQVLAAEAQKKRIIAEAEGKKEAAFAEAEGLVKLGDAKAQAQKLLLTAYAVPGADLYAKTQIAEKLGNAFSGIRGYLPSDMKVSVLSRDFMGAIDSATGSPIINIPNNK